MPHFFGTDGIRGQVGEGFFVPERLVVIGRAIGAWVVKRASHGKKPRVLLLHDTRVSCDFIKSAVLRGMHMHPVETYDAGVLPTPAASYFADLFDVAVIISASHNPWHDNGIKIIDKSGKLCLADEIELSRLIVDIEHANIHARVAPIGAQAGVARCFADAQKLYCQKVIAHFPPNLLCGKKIVLDCAHGATYRVAPAIFGASGADVIVLNDRPDGRNINDNCGAVHPEELARTVVGQAADAGFAFDGDGDRVIAVNRHGEIKDGDDLLALLSTHPAYADQQALVGTILSNYGLERFLSEQGKSLVRVSVGDKYVVEALNQTNGVLGGEQAGHIILKDMLATGDGILSALRVAETIELTHNEDMRTFAKYPQVHRDIPLSVDKAICQRAVEEAVDSAQARLNRGRLVVRFSGTQPVLRIMAEASLYDDASAIVDELDLNIRQLLKDFYGE